MLATAPMIFGTDMRYRIPRYQNVRMHTSVPRWHWWYQQCHLGITTFVISETGRTYSMNQTVALSYVHFHPAKEETCTVFVSFVITTVNAIKKCIGTH